VTRRDGEDIHATLHLAWHRPLAEGLSGRFLEGDYRKNVWPEYRWLLYPSITIRIFLTKSNSFGIRECLCIPRAVENVNIYCS
jgi:hypothetical protein